MDSNEHNVYTCTKHTDLYNALRISVQFLNGSLTCTMRNFIVPAHTRVSATTKLYLNYKLKYIKSIHRLISYWLGLTQTIPEILYIDLCSCIFCNITYYSIFDTTDYCKKY